MPSDKPVSAIVVSVFAAETFTEFQLLSAALVMSEATDTDTVDFTTYTVLGFDDCTVAFAVFFTVAVARVTTGGPLSMVAIDTISSAAGPALPATSAMELAASFRSMVPFEHELTDTEITVPLEDAGVSTHPVAVPLLFETSAAVNPVIDSLKVNMYVVGKL